MSSRPDTLLVDCQLAGISGDMIIGALLGAGAGKAGVVDAMRSVSRQIPWCRSLDVATTIVDRGGFSAHRVEVSVNDEPGHRTGPQLVEVVRASAKEAGLGEAAARMATGAAKVIVEAEAKMHGKSPEEVELHEIGSSDTVADLIGAAAALESIGFFRGWLCYTTPVAVGGGLFRFSHGALQSPAPMTLELLRSQGIPIVGGPVEGELATPTGAAILARMRPLPISYYPAMQPHSVGYGAGAKDLPSVPNVLRVIVAESARPLLKDEVYVLETNLDDATGETIGHASERLMEGGAKDVSIIPVFGKKGRPGHVIKVLADRMEVEHLVKLLIAETGTLGVRLYPCERHVMARQVASVEVTMGGEKGVVRLKVSRSPNGETVVIKPEHEDLKALAKRTGIPLRIIAEEVMVKAKRNGLDGTAGEHGANLPSAVD